MGAEALYPIDEADNRLIRPTPVHPKPLLRSVADPLLQGRVDPGHQRRGVGMKVAASGYRQGRKYGKPKVRAVEPFDPSRQHIAVKAQCQNGESGSGHRWMAEARHGNSVIHLLVGQQARS